MEASTAASLDIWCFTIFTLGPVHVALFCIHNSLQQQVSHIAVLVKYPSAILNNCCLAGSSIWYKNTETSRTWAEELVAAVCEFLEKPNSKKKKPNGVQVDGLQVLLVAGDCATDNIILPVVLAGGYIASADLVGCRLVSDALCSTCMQHHQNTM